MNTGICMPTNMWRVRIAAPHIHLDRLMSRDGVSCTPHPSWLTPVYYVGDLLLLRVPVLKEAHPFLTTSRGILGYTQPSYEHCRDGHTPEMFTVSKQICILLLLVLYTPVSRRCALTSSASAWNSSSIVSLPHYDSLRKHSLKTICTSS